jgi:two-component system sensor histidine kinase/response regulator
MNTAICDVLEFNQFRVVSAFNGQMALDMMAHERPNLVLCDIMMPRMDGYTLLQHTRSDESLRTLPFIFLTARTSTEDRRRAKSIGIEDYLTKPFEPEELLVSVNNALRRAESVSLEIQRQLDDMRNQIVAVLQHEFRTPLTLVLGYAEFLQETPSLDELDLEDLRTSAGAILEGGHRLQKLIEGFLLLADMQGRTSFGNEMEMLDCHTLIAQAVTEMTFLAKAANLKIQIIGDTSCRILASERHLRDAIKRMLDNAIRYRRPESMHVWITVAHEAGYTGISIQDEGIGISPEVVLQLSQPFAQVDRRNRETPGAGLSLALIQQVARLHGGDLTIDSEYGKGSAFTLWLPTVPPQ